MAKLTRDDYARMVGLGGPTIPKRKKKKAGGAKRGKFDAMETVMLSKMASKQHNKNARLRNAVIDNMNPKQLRAMGHALKALIMRRHEDGMLSKEKIKQLNRNHGPLRDLIKGAGNVTYRRKILKGGFIGSLLPALLGPVIQGVVSPILGAVAGRR